jgi:uncharacterized repeat protein (TIGR03803 family)
MNTRFLYSIAFVFSTLLIAAPGQAQTETVLYNFCSQPNCTDGSDPSALIFDSKGNIYGTTSEGGANSAGTVFELSSNGSGGWNENVLYNFCSAPNCTDGSGPGAPSGGPGSPVIFDSVGNLYGTTYGGGENNGGTVFELSLVGGVWTETVLYNFCSQPKCADGTQPESGMVVDSAGNLYGLVNSEDETLVYELSPSEGGWTKQVIYSVTTYYAIDNNGLVMDTSGDIFTLAASPPPKFRPCVVRLSPNGQGGWNSTYLYDFGPTSPTGTLALDKAGNIYGTTLGGGIKENGTVYKLSLAKNGKWAKKVLYAFEEPTHWPWAGVVLDASGNVFGTTQVGGQYICGWPCGTVYELSPVGKKYQEKLLWEFNGTDGWGPQSSMILDDLGNLYGEAVGGSTYPSGCYGNGCGVVFEVTP